jgi:hypothetical protein
VPAQAERDIVQRLNAAELFVQVACFQNIHGCASRRVSQ